MHGAAHLLNAQGPGAGQRIHKVLAKLGIGSRRSCEKLVAEGRVKIDGVTCPVGYVLDGFESISLDEREIHGSVKRLSNAEHLYYLVNKPRGIISTCKDTHQRPTIISLLPDALQKNRLYPVGRLDAESQGLVLLTNDGDVANSLLHPSKGVPKEYVVCVSWSQPRSRAMWNSLLEKALDQIRGGLKIDEETTTAPLKVTQLRNLRSLKAKTLHFPPPPSDSFTFDLQFVLKEGRKRQIRLMCQKVGLVVHSLVRTKFGTLEDFDLPVGGCRKLTASELVSLKSMADKSIVSVCDNSASFSGNENWPTQPPKPLQLKRAAHTVQRRIRNCFDLLELLELVQELWGGNSERNNVPNAINVAFAVQKLANFVKRDREKQNLATSLQLDPRMRLLISMVEKSIWNFNSQCLANVTWSFVALSWLPTHGLMNRFYHQAERVAEDFKPQEIGIFLWSVAKILSTHLPSSVNPKQTPLKQSPGKLVPASCLTALLNVAASPSRGSEFDPQAISNTVYAIAKILHHDLVALKDRPGIIKLVPAACFSSALHCSHRFNAQDTSNFFWALGKLGLSPNQEIFNVLSNRLEKISLHLKPQELSNVLWALAKFSLMKATGPSGALVVDNAVPSLLLDEAVSKCREFKPLELSKTLWAAATLQLLPLPPKLVSRFEEPDILQLLNIDEIALSMWALGNQTYGQACLHTDTATSQLCNAAIPKLSSCTSQNMSNMLWSLGTLQINPSSRFLEPLMKAFTGLKGHVSSQSLANIIWAVAVLKIKAESSFLDAIVCRTQKLCKMDPHSFAPRGIASICWSFCLLEEFSHLRSVLVAFNLQPEQVLEWKTEQLCQLHQVIIGLESVAKSYIGAKETRESEGIDVDLDEFQFSNFEDSDCVTQSHASSLSSIRVDAPLLSAANECLALVSHFGERCSSSFLSQSRKVNFSSYIQNDVAFLVREVVQDLNEDSENPLLLKLEENVVLEEGGGYSVDMCITCSCITSLGLIIEVDGPSHFVREASSHSQQCCDLVENGETQFKKRTLRRMGWHVLSVSFTLAQMPKRQLKTRLRQMVEEALN